MEILNIALLVLAYTLGVATIILQVVCFIKKIEHPITIAFSAAFLFFIGVFSVNQIGYNLSGLPDTLPGFWLTIAMWCMAITLPANIHLERRVRHAEVKTKVSLIIPLLILVTYIVGLFMGAEEWMEKVVRYYFYATAIYAMVLILSAKPTLLIQHREKAERITSMLFFAILAPLIALEMSSEYLPFLEAYIPTGSFSLSVFYIFMCVSKITDDVQRLTLFVPENEVSPHVISRFGITPREVEVMTLIVKGSSYNDISEQLHISLPTVKTHVSRVYKKVGVSNKVELINFLKTA